jgi:hypothetical protein
MSAAWEAWLAECLGALGIDADVFGPYVTGIMVRCRCSARSSPPRLSRMCTAASHLHAACVRAHGARGASERCRSQEDGSQPEDERASSVVRCAGRQNP